MPLSAGIGALEVAFVMTIVFNYVVLLLWVSDYGGIQGRRRYLRESHEEEAEAPEAEAEEEAVGEPDQPTKSEA